MHSAHAIKAFLNRNLIDRGEEHFPIGPSVQIAVDSQWMVTIRAISHSAGNLLIGGGNEISKWRKCKARLSNLENRDEMGRVPVPANARVWNKRRRWLADEYPAEYRPTTADPPEHSIQIPDSVGIRDSSLSEEELMSIGKRATDAPGKDGYGPDDAFGEKMEWKSV